MAEAPVVAAAVLERLRALCLGLPDAYEEQAWVGTRWRVRTRTFAHVLVIDGGWPPVYARAASTDGPATVLMFRSAGPELDALRAGPPPWVAPPWRADEVALLLGTGTDWAEVAELVTESYCVLAPRILREKVERPAG
ncbi:MAG: MmcQ/YjbR family DNA-binding protein [Acidimicrobiia bacterium]|nr:MmcQ/YjbR family DNA-binding protein [Acidimicrobiia bacterium]